MNIKNMLLTVGLTFSVVTTALSVGEQYKDLVYTMHALGQDFSQSSFIRNNIDRIIDLFNIQIRIVEKELQSTPGSVKILVDSISAISIASILPVIGDNVEEFLLSKFRGNTRIIRDSVGGTAQAVATAIVVYFVIKAYDVCKTRKSLKKIITLDKTIVAKLIELREAMTLQDTIEDDIIDENDQLVEYDRSY